MSKTPSVKILVTSKKGDLNKTVSTLKKHGMNVASVLGEIGVVSGEIQEAQLPKLRSIPGISIERDDSVQLPPPDSPVQ